MGNVLSDTAPIQPVRHNKPVFLVYLTITQVFWFPIISGKSGKRFLEHKALEHTAQGAAKSTIAPKKTIIPHVTARNCTASHRA